MKRGGVQQGEVKFSKVESGRGFLIIYVMTLKEAKEKAASNRPVEEDKFDSHMKRARLLDIESKRRIFVLQSERAEAQREEVEGIQPSVY